MALAASQKITRVLPGRPFGDGRDGALTISSNTTQSLTAKSCSGTSGTTTLTIGSGAFSNGDVVLIHQTRGTSAGVWEINLVASGGGTTSLTMSQALANTYTDSGASQAQVLKIPMYTTVTVNGSTTWSATDWDGDINGWLLFAASVSATITGSISSNGKGYIGGVQSTDTNNDYYGNKGESTTAAATSGSQTNNDKQGSGAGGGEKGRDPGIFEGGGGGGGGHATAGGAGETFNSSASEGGEAGDTVGNADLSVMVFGGAGGAGGRNKDGAGAATGGDSGGGVGIFAKVLTVAGGITSTGANGSSGSGSFYNGSGGGSGGSILIQGQTVTMGSSLITAAGGAGGNGSRSDVDGGSGGSGRIAAYYSVSISGDTSPTYTGTQDTTLVETLGGIVMFALT